MIRRALFISAVKVAAALAITAVILAPDFIVSLVWGAL